MTPPPFEDNIDFVLADIVLPPLELRWLSDGSAAESTARVKAGGNRDAVLEVCSDGLPPLCFAAKYKRQWTPKMIDGAVREAKQYAQQSGLLPLIIVPYLSGDRLLELEKEGVSGLDLCGNGIIIVPGKVLVFRTGAPNRFTTSAPIKNVYRGATSLIARAFLLQPSYASPGELSTFIAARGGSVLPATISKALQGIEDDLLISRSKNSLRLLQPDKLLRLLEKNYVPPKVTAVLSGRVSLSLPELRQELVDQAKEGKGTVAATGTSSAPQYVAMAMEAQAALYCRDATAVLASLLSRVPSVSFEETTRFPNLRFLQTSDPTAFFDVRRDAAGYPWSSPIQTYLEMVTDGEPRFRQSAEALRENLLNAVRKSRGTRKD